MSPELCFSPLGLHLLDILSFLRKEETDDDLHLQLEVSYKPFHCIMLCYKNIDI
jgi:hypothetical protein